MHLVISRMWDVLACDLMAVGLFYINVTGTGLIAWLDFMQGRSLSRDSRDAFLAGRARGRHLVLLLWRLHAARRRLDWLSAAAWARRCLHPLCEIDFFRPNHRALCAKKAPKTWVTGRLVIEINLCYDHCVCAPCIIKWRAIFLIYFQWLSPAINRPCAERLAACIGVDSVQLLLINLQREAELVHSPCSKNHACALMRGFDWFIGRPTVKPLTSLKLTGWINMFSFCIFVRKLMEVLMIWGVKQYVCKCASHFGAED